MCQLFMCWFLLWASAYIFHSKAFKQSAYIRHRAINIAYTRWSKCAISLLQTLLLSPTLTLNCFHMFSWIFPFSASLSWIASVNIPCFLCHYLHLTILTCEAYTSPGFTYLTDICSATDVTTMHAHQGFWPLQGELINIIFTCSSLSKYWWKYCRLVPGFQANCLSR